jgi:SAM-dependent methyltransferase
MDLVVCLHVMNHVPDDAKGYSELFRVLKPGGSLVLQAGVDKSLGATQELPPNATDAERSAKFGQVDLFRVYAGDIAERVTRHGFTFSEETARDSYTPEELQRKGISAGDFIFYCRKP